MSRVLACLIAVAALAAAMAAVVINAVAASRGAHHSLDAVGSVLFVLAVAAPAAVGLFVALRRPGNRVAVDPARRRAVGGCRDGRRRRREPGAVRGPRLDGRGLGRARGVPVAGAVPVAAGARVRVPGRAAASPRWRPAAALAASPRAAGCVVLLAVAAGARDRVRRRSPTRCRSPWPRALEPRVLGLLGRPARRRCRRRCARAARPLPRRRRRSGAARCCGSPTARCWCRSGSAAARCSRSCSASTNAVDFAGLLFLQVWPAVAVAVAVTRHGLYSIDRLLNRTLVYAALTAAARRDLRRRRARRRRCVVGGSALTASLATLAAALAFRPLRARVQGAVDRRFARARYDAVRLLRDFLDEVRDGHAEPEDVGDGPRASRSRDPTRRGRVPAARDRRVRRPARARCSTALPDDGRARDGDRPRRPRARRAAARPRARRAARPAARRARRGRGAGRARAPARRAAAAARRGRVLARADRAGRLRGAAPARARPARRRAAAARHARHRAAPPPALAARARRALLSPALDAAVDEVGAAIADLRTIAAGVRPPRLDEGLAAALADLARGAASRSRSTRRPTARRRRSRPPPTSSPARRSRTRVKHASPSRVAVRDRARRTARCGSSSPTTASAAPPPPAAPAWPGMRDRVAAHGGTLAIESPPGAGTRIAVELPCAS